jgi:hypothetical protein
VAVRSALVASQNRTELAVQYDESAGNGELPEDFALMQNYPNPFNIETKIKFHLPARSKVTLQIYNLRGELVRTLIDGDRPAGKYEMLWDGRNTRQNIVASGVYIYRIRADDWKMTRRMTLLK